MTPRARLRRVLIGADAVGGVWTYVLTLATGLARHDVEIILAVMGPAPSAEQRSDAMAIPNLTLVESSSRLEWMDDAELDLVRAGDWLLGLALRYKPDL